MIRGENTYLVQLDSIKVRFSTVDIAVYSPLYDLI